jgi:hypothetical protein
MKVYPCKHCGVRFVVLPTQTGSVLPVEIYENNDPKKVRAIEKGEFFDSRKHISHLKNCPERQQDWDVIKKQFIQEAENKLKLSQKELLQ